jgi:hypothetical protein
LPRLKSDMTRHTAEQQAALQEMTVRHTQPLIEWVAGSERSEREADVPSLYNAEFIDEWGYTCTPLFTLHSVHRYTLAFDLYLALCTCRVNTW